MKEYQQEIGKDYKRIVLYLCSVEERDFGDHMEVPSLPRNNKNDNPNINILMSENIRQKRLKILEYFDAYICHHYQDVLDMIGLKRNLQYR